MAKKKFRVGQIVRVKETGEIGNILDISSFLGDPRYYVRLSSGRQYDFTAAEID